MLRRHAASCKQQREGKRSCVCTSHKHDMWVPCGVQGHKAEMQQMYQEWPFFQSTMDLIEMILSKCDMRIAAMYDHQLAETEEEKALGVVLRGKYEETVKAVLEVMLQRLMCIPLEIMVCFALLLHCKECTIQCCLHCWCTGRACI